MLSFYQQHNAARDKIPGVAFPLWKSNAFLYRFFERMRRRMVQLTATGEVVEINQADQMQPGHSEYECGIFGVMMARSMVPPGEMPTLTPAQIISGAEAAYPQYDGNNGLANTNGMTLKQEYELLAQVGL